MGVVTSTANAGATYVPLMTSTLASAVASVTLSSIPSTYTDLVVVYNGNVRSNSAIYIEYNGDTATNYSMTRLYGNGSTATSTRSASVNLAFLGDITTSNNTVTTQIQNYSNTNTYETAIARSSDASTAVSAAVALWRNKIGRAHV